MKLTNLVLAAILVVGSVPNKAHATCEGMNFHLWDADRDLELLEFTPMAPNDVLCAQPFYFSISADPGNCWDSVESARLTMRGEKKATTIKNEEPYTVFGDELYDDDYYYTPFEEYDGDIYGRSMDPGNYTVTAKFYPRDDAKGTKVAQLSVSFTVVDCY